MNNLHHCKDQGADYVALEQRFHTQPRKSALGLVYVSERLRGKVVSSKWFEHVDEDGTRYKLNQRVRVGLTATGKEFRKTDRTLLISEIGEVTRKEISDSGSFLMHTTLGVVCTSCLTSDHVLEDKDGSGFTCTRCNSWIANAK